MLKQGLRYSSISKQAHNCILSGLYNAECNYIPLLHTSSYRAFYKLSEGDTMKHQYKKKPKQEQIERLLNIYAAIGAAAKEQPAPNTEKMSRTLEKPTINRG